ncbi:MAG: hypothetical protein PHF86_10470 [Candidatus Nanoarchaeia archaeon]|nr:hypothetical protein [Candidatus Nanoarchaeia archaeon]
MMNEKKKFNLIKKVRKDYPDFVNAVANLQLKELEKTFNIYSKHREETQQAKENDVQLVEISEQKAELEAPYSDALKALKLKLTYLYFLIKEKEEVIGPKVENKAEVKGDSK